MWFQTPQYLRWSRMHLLKPENRQRMIRLIGIRPGDRVLDVGCGSGELTRYLAQGVDAEFVGIDLEEGLIAAAREGAHPNTSFLQADALALPFGADRFDVVISHTFFTAVFEAEKAMAQMRRVCKPGGIIASITADSIRMLPHSPGVYRNYPWAEEFHSLRRKLDMAFHMEAERCCVGVLPEDMPRFFAGQGLKNVRVYPIEKFSCLSNLDREERKNYLQLEYESELSRLELLPQQERQRYVQLLQERKKDLCQPENEIWDWSGGTNLLIVAANEKQGPDSHNEPDGDLFQKALQQQENIRVLPMRTHVAAFASVQVTDGSGQVLYGTGTTPSAAMDSGYKKLIARQYARQGGELCAAEALLQDNRLLKKCLKQMNMQLEDTDAAYLQELVQWESVPVTDEFTHKVTGEKVRLPRWLTQWCFGEDTCCAGRSPGEAKLESLHRLCARFACKQIITGQLTPPKLPDALWQAVPEVREAVSVLRGRGIRVNFFDGSCGMDLPVIGAYAVGNGGAKIRTCGGGSLAQAIKGCMADLLEGCTVEKFFTAAGRITNQKPSIAQLYNVLTTGEGYLPVCVLGQNANWTARSWEETARDPETACGLLQERLRELGWEIYGRAIPAADVYVHQTIVPGGGMLYDFGSQRLLEYRLRKLAQPVLRDFANAAPDAQALAMKYVSLKRNWIRENTFAYLAGVDQNPQLFGTDVDGRILLGLYAIHTGDLQAACSWLPENNMEYRCLKALLGGEPPEALAALYSPEAAEKAQALLRDPLAVLPRQ